MSRDVLKNERAMRHIRNSMSGRCRSPRSSAANEAGDGHRVAPTRLRAVLGVESRRRGRPPTSPEIVALIVRIANDNPRWSRRRIANELTMLGYRVDKNTVAKYMPKPSDRPRRPLSQTWGTFMRNHLHGTLAADFFTVPAQAHEAADHEGSNVHASVRIEAADDLGRERLCRYGARPPFSLERFRKLPGGRIGTESKKWGGGRAKLLVVTPLKLLARIAALIPPPRYPLVRYHGVLAPRSSWRRAVIPRPPEVEATHAKQQRREHVKGADRTARRERSAHSSSRGDHDATPPPNPRPRAASAASDFSATYLAPNVIAVPHWERLCGGLLFAIGGKMIRRTPKLAFFRPRVRTRRRHQRRRHHQDQRRRRALVQQRELHVCRHHRASARRLWQRSRADLSRTFRNVHRLRAAGSSRRHVERRRNSARHRHAAGRAQQLLVVGMGLGRLLLIRSV